MVAIFQVTLKLQEVVTLMLIESTTIQVTLKLQEVVTLRLIESTTIQTTPTIEELSFRLVEIHRDKSGKQESVDALVSLVAQGAHYSFTCGRF